MRINASICNRGFRVGKIAIYLIFIALTNASVAQRNENTKVNLSLKGTVTNVTCGLSSGVTFTIKSSDGIAFQAAGEYDSKNLYGRFDVPGKVTQNDGNCICLEFSGELELGKEGAATPVGTKAPYVMTVMLTPQGGKGVYRIGKIPSVIDLEQYGCMDLSHDGAAR